VNYWGYNTLGFFTPEPRYASVDWRPTWFASSKRWFATSRGGMEVILDVVYNHTAEGSQMGPTFSFRGIDNAAYYRLAPILAATPTSPLRQYVQHAQSPRAADDHGQSAVLDHAHAH